jgi:hypothetical protein
MSEALRIRRICSTDKSLKKRLGQLKNHLKRRGYKQSIMKKSLDKAHSNSSGKSFFQRFIVGANSPESKSLTV